MLTHMCLYFHIFVEELIPHGLVKRQCEKMKVLAIEIYESRVNVWFKIKLWLGLQRMLAY